LCDKCCKYIPLILQSNEEPEQRRHRLPASAGERSRADPAPRQALLSLPDYLDDYALQKIQGTEIIARKLFYKQQFTAEEEAGITELEEQLRMEQVQLPEWYSLSGSL